MTTRRVSLFLLAVMVLTVVVARGRGGDDIEPGWQSHTVTGTVTAAPADGRVMVSHDAIAGYMPAMTMPFPLAPGQAHPRLVPGSVVRFRLLVGPSASRADRIEVTGHDQAVAAALAAPARPPASRLRAGDTLPPFALVDQRGAGVTQDRFRGRRTAVTFIFTRCPVPEFCPLMVQRFLEVQRAVERDSSLRDVRLVGITLDPASDTPAVLAAYATAKQMDPERWMLLTGAADEIAGLTRAFAIHVERNGVFLDHTLATAVIDADGRIVEIWRGNRWSAGEVVAVLRGRRPPTTE